MFDLGSAKMVTHRVSQHVYVRQSSQAGSRRESLARTGTQKADGDGGNGDGDGGGLDPLAELRADPPPFGRGLIILLSTEWTR